MVTYEYKGKVEAIEATQTFGSKGFTKRNFIVDAGGKYPNPVQFTLKRDNCEKVDGLRKGMEVSVKFTVDGRRWDGPNGTKYFVDLTALDVTPVGGSAIAPNIDVPPAAEAPADFPMSNDEDLPF